MMYTHNENTKNNLKNIFPSQGFLIRWMFVSSLGRWQNIYAFFIHFFLQTYTMVTYIIMYIVSHHLNIIICNKLIYN